MDRRVAQGRSPLASDAPSSLFVSVAIGSALVALALVIFTVSHPYRYYNHFEWQALAFLEGQTSIRYPVEATATDPGNAFFQDVLPVGKVDGVERGVVPFPPLPAIVLMPFVAAWGLAADGQLVFAIIGAIDVGLAWWVLGRLPIRAGVRIATTLFLGFGTVLWYAAQIGTTWYQAHVLAVGLALAAIGVALGGDRDAARSEDDLAAEQGARDGARAPVDDPAARVSDGRGRAIRLRVAPDVRQFLAGLLFGLACTSRLTIAFAAPFFLLVGAGGSWQRRGLSAALGAAIPLAVLVAYNVAATGHVFHPGYQYLYEQEAAFYTPLHYNLDWSIEDVRYLPQNVAIMFFNTPVWQPTEVPSALGLGGPLCTDAAAVRGLFDRDCPLVLPKDTGMSILLTSPAYLLGLVAVRWGFGLSRLVTGAALAVLVVALVNLMHFSQGWVQFGYRFSLDFAPFAVLLVALGLDRIVGRTGRARSPTGRRAPYGAAAAVAGGASLGTGDTRSLAGRGVGWLAVAGAVVLVVASVLVNFWGVVWANVLGW